MTLRMLTLAVTLWLPFAAPGVAEDGGGEAATVAAPAENAALGEAATAETRLVHKVLPPPHCCQPGVQAAGTRRPAAGNRRLQILVQLVDVSAPGNRADLGGIRIRAIAPDGSFDEAFSDRRGRATVGVQLRPTVLTATGRDLHATMMVHPRRVTTGGAPRPVLISLLRVSPEALLRATEGLGATGGAGGASWEPTEGRSVPPLRHRIPLTADGTLHGRLVSLFRPTSGTRDLRGMNIFILQEGQVVRRVTSDADGRFTVRGLAPGYYGVIASGRAGYGAFGFEAVRSVAAPIPAGRASSTPAAATLVSLR